MIRFVIRFCWKTKIYKLYNFFCESCYSWEKNDRALLLFILKPKRFFCFFLLLKISKKQINIIWHKVVHLKDDIQPGFSFQNYIKLLLWKGHQCCWKDLLSSVHLYEVITEKKCNHNMHEFSFTGKTNMCSKRVNI